MIPIREVCTTKLPCPINIYMKELCFNPSKVLKTQLPESSTKVLNPYSPRVSAI